jgi:gentisate 1,2-dioxygenase
LIITSGAGWVQEWNGEKREVRAGDVIWTPPGVKHWHGATSTTAMTHIAIQENVAGRNVDWMEHVTDEQYGAFVAAAPQTPVSSSEVRSVSPALERFRQHTVREQL